MIGLMEDLPQLGAFFFLFLSRYTFEREPVITAIPFLSVFFPSNLKILTLVCSILALHTSAWTPLRRTCEILIFNCCYPKNTPYQRPPGSAAAENFSQLARFSRLAGDAGKNQIKIIFAKKRHRAPKKRSRGIGLNHVTHAQTRHTHNHSGTKNGTKKASEHNLFSLRLCFFFFLKGGTIDLFCNSSSFCFFVFLSATVHHILLTGLPCTNSFLPSLRARLRI